MWSLYYEPVNSYTQCIKLSDLSMYELQWSEITQILLVKILQIVPNFPSVIVLYKIVNSPASQTFFLNAH